MPALSIKFCDFIYQLLVNFMNLMRVSRLENDAFGLLQSISASISAEISRNGLTGSIKLDDFTMSLKWSKIGYLHMLLIEVSWFDLLISVGKLDSHMHGVQVIYKTIED